MNLTGWFTQLLLALCLTGPGFSQNGELVPVAHQRELRGAWVASVANLNWPSQSALPLEAQQKELLIILDRLQEARLNAIFFQVRPEGDALYRSELEPWSRFLGGTQGSDPGFDPLEFLIEAAHQRNIEVHAWLNPYRAQAVPPATAPPVAPHLAVEHPDQVHAYGQLLWMDPSAPAVRQRLLSVCRDLTERYDIDGLHFDDYFYPYPEGELEFPDQANWDGYQAGGGALSRGDWRREQVNLAIQEVSQAIQEEKDYVRFGISPFGIPAPEKPAQILGLDQYEKLYADTQLWMDRGWVDYLAPQLYWPTTREAQAFPVLLEWWADHARQGRYIFAGINLAALGSKPEWSLEEYRQQFALVQRHREGGARGFILWSVAPLLEGRQNVGRDLLAAQTPQVVLTPPLARASDHQVNPPELDVQGNRLWLHHQDGTPLRAWTVYRAQGPQWTLAQIVPGEQDSILMQPGRWAVAAVCKDGQESLGQVVEIPQPP